MINFIWPWAFAALPLPLLIRGETLIGVAVCTAAIVRDALPLWVFEQLRRALGLARLQRVISLLVGCLTQITPPARVRRRREQCAYEQRDCATAEVPQCERDQQ